MLKLFLISALLNSNAIPQQINTDLNSAFIFAANENNVPVKLVRAVSWVESNHRLNLPIRPDGRDLTPSYGPMQIKLATARLEGYKGTAAQLRNPVVNIYYGAKHLRTLLDKYDSLEKALTAYNRGCYRNRYRLNNSYVIKVKLAMMENR